MAHPRLVLHLRFQQLDLRLVHLADGRLVDLLGGDMLDQDIAQDIVAGGVQPVTGLRVFIQPPLQGFHGQQLHLDQFFQDVVEFGAAGLDLFARLDDAL